MRPRDIKLLERADKDALTEPFSASMIAGCLRFFDGVVIGLVAIVVYFFYVYQGVVSGQYMTSILIGVLLASVLFDWLGVYNESYFLSSRPRVARILGAWAITFAILLTVAFALKISSFYSRVWVTSWFVATYVLLTVSRIFLSHWIAKQSRIGGFAERTVIVGVGEQGRRLADHLKKNHDIRTRVLGSVRVENEAAPGEAAGLKILGDVDDLIDLIRQGRVDQVFVALPWHEEARLKNVIEKLAMTPVVIRLAPDLIGFEFTGRPFTQVAQLPMLHIIERPISGWASWTKALEDRVLASAFLVLLAPLLLVIAIAIKLDSRGPVLFKQKRYGFNNKLIEVWKFRSMYEHMSDAPGEIRQAIKGDPRVTRIGGFLRRTSLDELPQLINVLRGDMSIVGPRPHPVATRAKGHLFEDIVDSYAARHRVKPGITGWAQVNGWRGETDTLEKIENRVDCDLYYIENWSIRFDLLIMAKTLLVLFTDKNAY